MNYTAVKDTIVWLIEPAEIQEQAKSYFDRLVDARGIYPPNAVLKNIQSLAWAEIHQFGAEDAKTIRLPCKSIQRFDTKAEEAIRELSELAQRAKSGRGLRFQEREHATFGSAGCEASGSAGEDQKCRSG